MGTIITIIFLIIIFTALFFLVDMLELLNEDKKNEKKE